MDTPPRHKLLKPHSRCSAAADTVVAMRRSGLTSRHRQCYSRCVESSPRMLRAGGAAGVGGRPSAGGRAWVGERGQVYPYAFARDGGGRRWFAVDDGLGYNRNHLPLGTILRDMIYKL
eukprot:scaffold5800_cov98-Isochrysis_galbana.AAC.2